MSADDALDRAIEQFLDAAERGEPPNREDYVARHPELSKGLRDFFEDLDEVGRLSRPIRDLAGVRRPPFTRRLFGKYELLEIIAQGGMGVVYKALQTDMRRLVALKMMTGPRPSAREIRRFHVEAEAVMSLDHPQIVRLHDFGESEGRPFFTMQLLEGGTLDDHLPHFRDAKAAARLVEYLARAVEHAHRRGILHRDLKPGNILFDLELHPYVGDWGLAKQVKGDEKITQTGVIFGTPDYMAPEQFMGTVTTQADVYSLGVILYELLTGRVPFAAETAAETLALKSKGDPEPPPVDRGLQAVCLKCLERKPEDRYKSAKDLADDLERWLAGKPVHARPGDRAARLMRAVRNLSNARVRRILEESRRRELRQELLFTSGAVADRVLMKLKDWSGAVLEAANDPELHARLRRNDPGSLQEFLDRVRRTFDDPARGVVEPDEKSPFESWILFDPRGVMIACAPDASIVGQDFSRREWYRGAAERSGKRGLDSVHVSRVFLSLLRKNLCKFTLSVPVYGGNGAGAPVLGVLGASFTTDSSLGIPRLNDDRHKVVVVGRWDPDSEGGYSASDYLVLVHPAYRRGEEAVKISSSCLQDFVPNPLTGELRSPEPGQVGMIDERFEDPLAERDARYKGLWWAGIAPVGNTPFVAIVQRRPDPIKEREAEIGVGLLTDLTGATSAIGEPYAEGVQAYTDWFNSQGGINGKTIRLTQVDYANKISQALKIYSRLKTVDRVVAVQGWGTGDAEALCEQASRDRMPFFSASYSAHLADPRRAPYNFFVAADYSSQLRAGLRYFRDAWKESRRPRVAFVFPDHPYGRSPIPAGRKYADELGFEIVGEEIVALDAIDAGAPVRRLMEGQPDVTWVGGSTPSTMVILKDARKLGLRTRFLINLWGNDEGLLQLGEAAEGVTGLQASALYGDEVPGMKAIREATRGEPKTSHYIRGWVSMMVLCEALRRAEERGDLSGPGIKTALETLSDFDPQGLMPPITYTADDHRPSMTVRIYEYSGGLMHPRAEVSVERRAEWLGF